MSVTLTASSSLEPDASAPALCSVRPAPVMTGDFVNYLLQRHRRRVKLINVLPA